MHPSGMMMSPDGHYMQPAVMGGYGAMPYMPVHDPAMQQMQGVPPMPGGPGMPGVPVCYHDSDLSQTASFYGSLW